MGDETNLVDLEAVEAEVKTSEVESPTQAMMADWSPADFCRVAKETADALCSQVDMALKAENPAAIRFREDVGRLLEQIELEIR